MAVAARAEELLATKFSPPRRPEPMIGRPRLVDMIDRGAQGPITLVAAPAGSGKTALVSAWVAAGRPRGPVAWLSLDAEDADPRRFWRTVLESLARATGDEAIAALSVSPREPLNVGVVLCSLVDAVAARDTPVTLVLDDFHEVADAVQDDVERLARFAPSTLRLIICARSDPALALGRLRLDGGLSEIRTADLAFTLRETVALLDALDLELVLGDVQRLHARTEGWAAALRLAGVSLASRPDPRWSIHELAAGGQPISDYLVNEVLAQQPPDVRDFMLRTSILTALSTDLADAVTGARNGRAMIARLEHAGVLTTLDAGGAWHRYHSLLAELLRAELRAQLPDEIDELHGRAASWLAANGRHAAAMRHAVAGRRWDLLLELIAARWVDLIIEGEISGLRTTIEAMPGKVIETSPELCLAYASALLPSGDRRAALYLRRAQDALPNVDADRRAALVAGMAGLLLYQGRLQGDPVAALKTVRTLLDRDAVLDARHVSGGLRAFVLCQLGIVELWTGDLEPALVHLERAASVGLSAKRDWIVLVVRSHLAVAWAIRGDVTLAVRSAEEALALAQRRGWTRSEPIGAAYCILAAVAIEQGRRGDAAMLLERAAPALSEARDLPLRAVLALLQATHLVDAGHPEAALTTLQVAREDLGSWPLLPQLESQLVAHEALLRAAVGQRELARAMLERAECDSEASAPVANALAKLRLLDGDAVAARELLARRLARDEATSPQDMPASIRAETWFIDALALEDLGDRAAAGCSLERALDLAAPAGLSRLIAAHGTSARSLLRRHARNGTAHRALVERALETVEQRASRARPPVPLAAPLSEREQAILRYLPTMMSNQEIADELYVSVNTVKTHLKAIYRKLDATDRRQAIERGRWLGLMP